jgi:hypothetical protein
MSKPTFQSETESVKVDFSVAQSNYKSPTPEDDVVHNIGPESHPKTIENGVVRIVQDLKDCERNDKKGRPTKDVVVKLISKLSSTPQKSKSRFTTFFFTCKDAFLKFECHIFYIG